MYVGLTEMEITCIGIKRVLKLHKNSIYPIYLSGCRNSTLVRITVTPRGQSRSVRLDAGKYHEFEISSRESVIVTSSKPVLVAQLCKSFNADGTRNSDPFMMLATPTAQLSNYYVYSTPGLAKYEHYANIFIDFSHVKGIRLDGRPLRDSDFLSSWSRAGKEFAFAKLKMAAGVHVLTHANHFRFGAVAYGLGWQESYGITLGMYARDYRDDFPMVTTEQERVTTPDGTTLTNAWTTPEVTPTQSTGGTTVGMAPTTEAATTNGSTDFATTSTDNETLDARDVATTEMMDIRFTHDQDGSSNETSQQNSSDISSNDETAATSAVLTESNTTMNYSVASQLQTSTVVPLDVSNTTLPEASSNSTEATTDAAHVVTSDYLNNNISTDMDRPPFSSEPPLNFTAWFDESNTTTHFPENMTMPATVLKDNQTAETSTTGTKIAMTEITTKDNYTSTPNTVVSTVTYNRTSLLTGNTTVRVKTTPSTTNDTTETTAAQVEGNASVHRTTEAMLPRNNLTRGTVVDILTTTTTVAMPTEVKDLTRKSDFVNETTTPEIYQVINTTTFVYEETVTSKINTDYGNSKELNVLPATTQSSLDMLNTTQSPTESTLNVTSDSAIVGGLLNVTQPPPVNHSATTTFETNETDAQQNNATYSTSTLTMPNATERSNISTSLPPTNQTEALISLDEVEDTTLLQSPDNTTTAPEKLLTSDAFWNNETQANISNPTTSSDTYNNTTEVYIFFVDDTNITESTNQRVNETVWGEDNGKASQTEANVNGTTTLQITTQVPSDAEVNTMRTENITNGTIERDHTTNIPQTVVSDFINVFLRKNVSVYSNLTGSVNDTSLSGTTSSLGSMPSSFTEVTPVNPTDNTTSSVTITTTHTIGISDDTTSNASYISEYVGQTNESTPEDAEYVEKYSNETTILSYDLNAVLENATASPTVPYRDINDTNSASVATVNDTIWNMGPVSTTEETTASNIQTSTEPYKMESNGNETIPDGTDSVITYSSDVSFLGLNQTVEPSPSTTLVVETTTSETTSTVPAAESTTLSSSSYTALSTTTLADIHHNKPLTNNSVPQTNNNTNTPTTRNIVRRQNHYNLTTTTDSSEQTPNSEEVSEKKSDIGLTATILVATLFGVPLVLLCGCFCYGVCCGACRKRGRAACCGCAKRRRRDTRVRPTSQWSSSSQRSDTSSRRSSLVYIDPSVLESRGLVPPPARKKKLDFLNFYQKPSCSSWVEVVDEEAGNKNRKLDDNAASGVKDLHGKAKGKGKRSKSAYGRNRKVVPALDSRPPLPGKRMNSRMEAYIVKH